MFYLLAIRSGNSPPVLEKLKAETLFEAKVEADERLQGDPSRWRAELVQSVYEPQVRFSLNDDKGTLLQPGFIPYEQVLVLEVASERPALDFYTSLIEWAEKEKTRITGELEANPDYQEYKRLKRRFSGGNNE